MRTIVGSLIWKEWREHQWKLAAITAVLWGVVALILHLGEDRDMLAMSIALVTMCMVPLSVFIGLGAAASERSRNTLPFLQALPVPMWRTALVKLGMGFAVLVAAILLTLAFLYLGTAVAEFTGADYSAAAREARRGSYTGQWYFDFVLTGTTVAVSFYIWAAASGVNRKDEVSAGAVALAVMAGWYFVLAFVGFLSDKCGASPWSAVLLVSTVPGGVLLLANTNASQYVTWSLSIGIALATHLALVTWYLRRFGRVADLEVRSPQVAGERCGKSVCLPLPRATAFTAIVWKQFRESVPLVLCGIAAVAVIVVVVLLSSPLYYAERPTEFAEVSAAICFVMCFLVAIVVGIGVCLHDGSPGLAAFWRSRPVNADLWFWTKYATGLLVLLTAMYGPVLIVLFMFHRDPWGVISHPDVGPMILAPIAIFAAAAMTTCLVRQAVYSAILSFAVVYLGILTGIGLSIAAGVLRFAPVRRDWWEPKESDVLIGLLISVAASTLLAWLAVRYDWGRKGRY